MTKWSHHENYWNPDPPSPDDPPVPSIPPRPLVAEPLLPRHPHPTRFESLWLPVILGVLGLLVYAYGMWRVS